MAGEFQPSIVFFFTILTSEWFYKLPHNNTFSEWSANQMTCAEQHLWKLCKETHIKSANVSQYRTFYSKVNTISVNKKALLLCFVIGTPDEAIA